MGKHGDVSAVVFAMFPSSAVVSNENAMACILNVIMMFSLGLIGRKRCQHLQVE